MKNTKNTAVKTSIVKTIKLLGSVSVGLAIMNDSFAAVAYKTPGVFVQEVSVATTTPFESTITTVDRTTAPTKTALLLPAVQAAADVEIEGLELLESIGKYEQELVVYRAAKPTEKSIASRFELANKLAETTDLRFDGKIAKIDVNRLATRSSGDASASFEVDQLTGNFMFNSGLQKYRKDGSTKSLPSEGDLQDLAFRAIKELNLPVDFGEVNIAHIGGLNLGVTDGSGGTDIFEKLKTIRLSRVLGGLPVDGDGRLVLHFGEQAALSALTYQWPEIGEAKALSSRQLRDAGEMQEAALSELQAMAKKAVRSTLTEVELVVYDDGRGVMEPAYHVVLERLIDDGNKELVMIPYDFYIPVNAEPEALFPEMEIAEVQPKDGRDYEKALDSVNE